MNTYKIEITDTYGGEANYCWVRRFEVKASTMLGAARQLSKVYGGRWRKDFSCGDGARYSMANACICAFIAYADE